MIYTATWPQDIGILIHELRRHDRRLKRNQNHASNIAETHCSCKYIYIYWLNAKTENGLEWTCLDLIKLMKDWRILATISILLALDLHSQRAWPLLALIYICTKLTK